MQEFLECPECGVSLKSKNLAEHMSRVHGKNGKNHERRIKGMRKSEPLCPCCGRKMKDLTPFDEMYEEAYDLIDEEEYEEAIEILERVPEWYPEIDLVHSLLGIAFCEIGEDEESLRFFKRAVEKDSRCLHHWYNLGSAYIRCGSLSRAIKCFQKVLELNPDRRMRREVEKSLKTVTKLISMELENKPELDKDTWLQLDEHFARGKEYMEKGELDAAIKEFSYVASVDKRSEKARGNLGVLYLLKGDFERAREHLTKALEINPSYIPAFNNLLSLEIAKTEKDPEFLNGLRENLVIKHF